MDGIEKRPAVKALIEKGKAAGKLTTQEIDTVIVDTISRILTSSMRLSRRRISR